MQRSERLRGLERAADKLRQSLLEISRITDLEGMPGESSHLRDLSTTAWRIQNGLNSIRLDIYERESKTRSARMAQAQEHSPTAEAQ